jgi:hypothetical protein
MELHDGLNERHMAHATAGLGVSLAGNVSQPSTAELGTADSTSFDAKRREQNNWEFCDCPARTTGNQSASEHI